MASLIGTFRTLPQGPTSQRKQPVRVVKVTQRLSSNASWKFSATQVACKATGSPASGPMQSKTDVVADVAFKAITAVLAAYLTYIILMKAWYFLLANWHKLLAVETIRDSQVVLVVFWMIITSAIRCYKIVGRFLELPDKVEDLQVGQQNLQAGQQNLYSKIENLQTQVEELKVRQLCLHRDITDLKESRQSPCRPAEDEHE